MGLIVLLLPVQIVSCRLNEMLGDFINGFANLSISGKTISAYDFSFLWFLQT